MQSIYIINQQEHYSNGLKRILEITLHDCEVTIYSDIPKTSSSAIDLILVEPIFITDRGFKRNIEKIEKITKDYTVVILTKNINKVELQEVLTLPIRGILLKNMSTKKIIEGINTVLSGDIYVPPAIGKFLLQEYHSKKTL